MKIKIVAASLLVAFILLTCTPTKEIVPTRIRNLKHSEISSFHQPVNLTVAWVPYQENQTLVKTKKNGWKVVEADSLSKLGNVPIMMVTYPHSTDTIWLDMNTPNELIGKLVKHSLMTQQPIRRPFVEYFEEAKCQSCHPSDVKVNFD